MEPGIWAFIGTVVGAITSILNGVIRMKRLKATRGHRRLRARSWRWRSKA